MAENLGATGDQREMPTKLQKEDVVAKRHQQEERNDGFRPKEPSRSWIARRTILKSYGAGRILLSPRPARARNKQVDHWLKNLERRIQLKDEQLAAAHESVRKLHEQTSAMRLHELCRSTGLEKGKLCTHQPTVSPIKALVELARHLPEARRQQAEGLRAMRAVVQQAGAAPPSPK